MSNEAITERLALVERIGEVFRRTNLRELEYEGEGIFLKLSRSPSDPGAKAGLEVPRPALSIVHAFEPSVVPAAVSPAGPARHTISAGITGMLFQAASPDKPPFVKVGDVVTMGQTLCIIEAMKILNEVESDYAGTVLEVLQKDGTFVSPGTPLFVIEASSHV